MANDWIPVSGRLPEPYESVIVYDTADGVNAAESIPKSGGQGAVYWQDISGFILNRVTHWMPLPDPPVVEDTP